METIKFGNYWQTNNEVKEPIEWLVIDEKDGKTLLLSKYSLDCKPYHENSCDITWEECTLRKWINSDFINNAFSEEEQQIIARTRNNNPYNPTYGTSGGNTTEDKVFLLSIEEAQKYFKNDEERKCTPTQYTKLHNAWSSDDNFCYWWLRSSGGDQNLAAIVDYVGEVYHYSYLVNIDDGVVRPCIWIDSSKLENIKNS